MAMLSAEPAGAAVRRLLRRDEPQMSWINMGEVFYLIHRDQGEDSAGEVVRDLRGALKLELPTAERILEAGRVKSEYKMSYADAFAAATALAHDAVLWTGDPELLVRGAPWRWNDLRSG